jgi:hypothetical protein
LREKSDVPGISTELLNNEISARNLSHFWNRGEGVRANRKGSANSCVWPFRVF